MTPRIRRSRTTVLAVAAATTATLLLPAVSAHGVPPKHSRIAAAHFADPGFAKFGKYYYLYKTGTGFGVTVSSRPDRGYGKVHSSMSRAVPWVGNAPTTPKGHRLWAPDVWQRKDAKGRAVYTMYFTGWRGGSWKNNCLGIATSYQATANFVPQKNPICATDKAYEAIDPTHYLAKDGKRYMIWKISRGNRKDWRIRAVQMNSTGTAPMPHARPFTLASDSEHAMEAPSVIVHGGKVWLFVSRNQFHTCFYKTEAYSAATFTSTFRPVRTVISGTRTGSTCGPGGATVFQDGKTTRIAFHLWQGRAGKDDYRNTLVGRITWDSKGRPFLY